MLPGRGQGLNPTTFWECISPQLATIILISKEMLNLLSKYQLVEVIENECIVTQVGVYDEKLPEPSGNISSYTPPLVTIQLQYSQHGTIGRSHHSFKIIVLIYSSIHLFNEVLRLISYFFCIMKYFNRLFFFLL